MRRIRSPSRGSADIAATTPRVTDVDAAARPGADAPRRPATMTATQPKPNGGGWCADRVRRDPSRLWHGSLASTRPVARLAGCTRSALTLSAVARAAGSAPMSFHPSVCPHDCPSVCALEVERLPDGRLGKVRGLGAQPLHRRRDLRQGRPLPRALPSPRAPGLPAAAHGRRRARASSGGSAGTTRWTRSPRTCCGSSSGTAPRRSGPTGTPAPWASCSATASSG